MMITEVCDHAAFAIRLMLSRKRMRRVDDRPDPVQRTIFIDELPEWHGHVATLATVTDG